MLRYRVSADIVASSRRLILAASSYPFVSSAFTRFPSRLQKNHHVNAIDQRYFSVNSAADASADNSRSHSSSSSSSHHSSPHEYRTVSIPLAEQGDPLDVVQVHPRIASSHPSSNQIVVEVDAAGINPIDVMLCQGYGRSVVNLAQLASHLPTSDSESSPPPPTISLGREGVGRVLRVGDNIWNIPTGGRVWFSPSVGESSLGEVVHLTSKQEASPAPANLPDIEAASYPFAICTAWTALVGCAGVKPRPTPNSTSTDSFSSSSSSTCGGSGSAEAAAESNNPCMQFASQLGLDRSKIQSGLQALQSMAAPLEPLLSSFPAPVPINLNEQTTPKRALVLAGSGPVGLMTIQLLQYWGYAVTVTTTTASRGSLDALVEKQRTSTSPLVQAFPCLRIIDTTSEPMWLSTQHQSAEAKKSMALVVDGVGGNDVFEQCLPLLALTGQFVTLKGEFVKRTDERGLLQGALQGGAEYARLKARAAEFGVNYHWAVSTPSSRALNYVRELFESNVIQTNLLPIHVWRSLDAAPAALQAAAEQMRPTFDRTSTSTLKPKHVVLLERHQKRAYSTMRRMRTTAQHESNSFTPLAVRSFSSTASVSSVPKTIPPYRIVIFASSDFSIPALYALKQHAAALLENSTATVITPADKPTGRGQVVQASALKKAALECGFAVEQLPFDIDFKMTGYDLPEHLKSAVDVGVVVSFGYMIPARIIDAFPCGVINIHPSLLPYYRGSSPIQFAIAQGDKQTGVSIIDVHPTQIDGGNIISQSILPLPSDGTFASMSPVLAEQGAKQLIEVIQNLTQFRQNSLQQSNLTQPPAIAQSSSSAPSALTAGGTPSTSIAPLTKEQLAIRASAPRIPKSAGELLFHSHSPDMIYRIYRACYGFLPLFTHFQGMRITIHHILSPQEVTQRKAEAEKRKQTQRPSTKESPFPTMADAHAQGAGGIFYDADIQALGVVCTNSTVDAPQVIYVSEVQVAFKPNQVSASTFASGYLDKRRAVKPAPRKKDLRSNSSSAAAADTVEKNLAVEPSKQAPLEWKFSPAPPAAETKDASKVQPPAVADWFGPRLMA